MMDDNTLQQNQDDQQQDDSLQNQSYISAGSIESGPIEISQESAPQQVEYGNEAIERIEKAPEQALEEAERREIKTEDQTQKQQVQQQPVKRPVPKPQSNMPKYFGYRFDPRTANNLSNVKQNAGKGDPEMSGTWIYVLLDRMLKMRS